MSEVLSQRALNRATLARQLLLERSDMPAFDAVRHLVAMQTQEPQAVPVGLWSRLAGFDAAEIDGLLQQRKVVRTMMMRRTIHLMTAQDALALRPAHQEMLMKRIAPALRNELSSVDVEVLRKEASRVLRDGEPRGLTDVARELSDRWPDADPRRVADVLVSVVAVAQAPPRGLWGQKGAARNTLLEDWIGEPMPEQPPPIEDMIRRYLAAHGPASTADIRAWCGLAGLKDPIDRLRPDLVTYSDQRGRELLDVPGGPLPDPRTPAPPRFLPAFDNAVLSYDDRTRIVADEQRNFSVEGRKVLLVDGFVAGDWTEVRGKGTVAIDVAPAVKISQANRRKVVAEGRRLLAFCSLGDEPAGVRFTDEAAGP